MNKKLIAYQQDVNDSTLGSKSKISTVPQTICILGAKPTLELF